jgi:hypothetical protein
MTISAASWKLQTRMPLHYTFSHTRRLVIAVAKGAILAEEILAFLARIDAENARLYRKIFDVSELETVFADERISRLAEIVRARADPAGPIAVVAKDRRMLRQARLFAAAAGQTRTVEIFQEQHLARRWLDDLDV